MTLAFCSLPFRFSSLHDDIMHQTCFFACSSSAHHCMRRARQPEVEARKPELGGRRPKADGRRAKGEGRRPKVVGGFCLLTCRQLSGRSGRWCCKQWFTTSAKLSSTVFESASRSSAQRQTASLIDPPRAIHVPSGWCQA